MKFIAIIVAGGTGSRMGSDVPKQFLLIDNKPILVHSLEKFSSSDHIIISLHPEYHEHWEKLIKDYPDIKTHTLVSGGKTRYESVKNALNEISDKHAIVAVHDAVRPLVSRELVMRSFEEATTHRSAVPVIAAEDTIREISGGRSRVIDRGNLYRVQTPQTFDLKLLRQAYEQSCTPDITDDASLLEKMGAGVHFIEGEKANIKITEPGDLELAEGFLRGITAGC